MECFPYPAHLTTLIGLLPKEEIKTSLITLVLNNKMCRLKELQASDPFYEIDTRRTEKKEGGDKNKEKFNF